VFAADERLVFATLEELEVPLWEVLEAEGPKADEAAPSGEG
jgi:hypothetical protein